jgi:hypothetical protein
MRRAVPFALLLLAACGPSEPAKPTAKSGLALPTGPTLAGVGVIAGLQGRTLTLDHEAVDGGLPAGRHAFIADAAVLAEAPLESGSRVAFTYQDWTPQPLLTEVKPR